ncbi:transcriptional regulator [Schaalia vaccimaxillae]|uniref:transcriptional regulator n=1 Tax=Schaalia vaccimaxillae TaxID=183916 RepID=UPI0003B50242|nr:transcriptional regulator [Schaalia vaccimaxillae]
MTRTPSQHDADIFPLKVRDAANILGNQSKLAEWLGVSRSQATRWTSGQTEPTYAAQRAIIDLEFIIARARMVWDENTVVDWLSGSNAFLSGASPLEMIRRDRTSEVLEAIVADEIGVYA